MPLTLAQKLRIDKNTRLIALNAPASFAKNLGPLPPGASISAKAAVFDQIHWFVTTRARMEQELPHVLTLLKPGILCWIYYPKGSSGTQTDLTRDKGWEALLELPHLQWLSLISFDHTWSAFAMRLAAADDKKTPAKPADRPILDYIDPATKTVRLPEDLEKALKRNKAARTIYDTLAYSHRKEYVEWIVTAKRDETRRERVAGTIERLLKGWKNPGNR